jgi:predicted RNA-binding protein with EMAP domain
MPVSRKSPQKLHKKLHNQDNSYKQRVLNNPQAKLQAKPSTNLPSANLGSAPKSPQGIKETKEKRELVLNQQNLSSSQAKLQDPPSANLPSTNLMSTQKSPQEIKGIKKKRELVLNQQNSSSSQALPPSANLPSANLSDSQESHDALSELRELRDILGHSYDSEEFREFLVRRYGLDYFNFGSSISLDVVRKQHVLSSPQAKLQDPPSANLPSANLMSTPKSPQEIKGIKKKRELVLNQQNSSSSQALPPSTNLPSTNLSDSQEFHHALSELSELRDILGHSYDSEEFREFLVRRYGSDYFNFDSSTSLDNVVSTKQEQETKKKRKVVRKQHVLNNSQTKLQDPPRGNLPSTNLGSAPKSPQEIKDTKEKQELVLNQQNLSSSYGPIFSFSLNISSYSAVSTKQKQEIKEVQNSRKLLLSRHENTGRRVTDKVVNPKAIADSHSPIPQKVPFIRKAKQKQPENAIQAPFANCSSSSGDCTAKTKNSLRSNKPATGSDIGKSHNSTDGGTESPTSTLLGDDTTLRDDDTKTDNTKEHKVSEKDSLRDKINDLDTTDTDTDANEKQDTTEYRDLAGHHSFWVFPVLSLAFILLAIALVLKIKRRSRNMNI